MVLPGKLVLCFFMVFSSENEKTVASIVKIPDMVIANGNATNGLLK
jgi:hypothetical protein